MKNFGLFSVISLLFLSSCQQEKNTVSIKFDDSKGELAIKTSGSIVHSYTLKAGDVMLKTDTITSSKVVNIFNLLKAEKNSHFDIAYQCATKGKIDINIVIKELIDTTLSYSLPIYQETESNARISGNVAKVYRTSTAPTAYQEVRKWLFRKNKHLTDSIIKKMSSFYRTLQKSVFDEYKTNEKVPCVASLNGKIFQVYSNMVADHYALVAVTNQKAIDNYIEQKVANNFSGMSSRLGSFSCICSDKSGYYCLALIGINKDWSFQVQPLGLAIIDKVAPLLQTTKGHIVSMIDLKHNIRVYFPNGTQNIYGGASIDIVNWSGNGVWCNVTFSILAAGDVKSVTITRTHELCYYSEGFGYDNGIGPTKKTFFIKEIGPHHTFNFKMHLESGDNFIPISIEDYNGNVTSGKIIHRAAFTRSDAPSINIDNNIDIDID